MYKITKQQLKIMWIFGSILAVVMIFCGLGITDDYGQTTGFGGFVAVLFPILIFGFMTFYNSGWKSFNKLDK